MLQENSNEHEKEIEKLRKTLVCSFNFACTKPGYDFNKYVKQEFGEPYPRCLAKNLCGQNAFYFGNIVYCKCPMMIYLLKLNFPPPIDETLLD